MNLLTLINHFLNCTRRINLHRIQVLEPIYKCSILRKLLAKGIRKVMGRVCGLQTARISQMLCTNIISTVLTINNTLSLTFANCIANEQLDVVFPTPPFPPQKIHFNDVWSRTFRRVGSSVSNSGVATSIKANERIPDKNNDCRGLTIEVNEFRQ